MKDKKLNNKGCRQQRKPFRLFLFNPKTGEYLRIKQDNH